MTYSPNKIVFKLKTFYRENLYNTNEQFDFGGFRELIEAQAQVQTSTSLFAYKFTDPGVYSFYLSSDVNKKFVSSRNFGCTWLYRCLSF